ncbi:hypothetical protein ISN44_As08g016970 [Arabidopsis suecica]|uniref:Uncharacterized protein n=1 Tax=Arabidopsis suecica TaxID=45249 RepID=A0A8T2B4E7_ARASU|nr:hypothetical protein ISN44_As08g016970 [Arabidopsis suecica]
MAVFILLSVSKIWWESANKPPVLTAKEWLDRLFETKTAFLRIGFHEDQEYFRSYFVL